MTTFVLVHGAWHGGWCYAACRRSISVRVSSPLFVNE